jgi:hypothetical protein
MLPEILNQLQEIEKTRISLLRDSLLASVAKEKEVSPIIGGCHDAIVQAMVRIVTLPQAILIFSFLTHNLSTFNKDLTYFSVIFSK